MKLTSIAENTPALPACWARVWSAASVPCAPGMSAIMTPKPLTARAEGGTHDGERFDISEVTVGLLLNSRRNATGLEYYEVVLYMGGNLLAFVRDYDVAEWRGAIA